MTLSVGLAITALVLRNTLRTVRTGYLSVISDPFLTPFLAMCLLGALYVALSAALSVGREREMGTLETLFYGPIGHLDYLVGKFVAHWLVFLAMLVAFSAGCIALSAMTHLRISTAIGGIVGLASVVALAFIGLGLVAATVMRSMRGSLLLFMGLVSAIVVVAGASYILNAVVAGRELLGLIPLRDAVYLLNRFVTWLSPVSYLLNGTDAAVRLNWAEWGRYAIGSLAYGLVALGLATSSLRRNGVMR